MARPKTLSIIEDLAIGAAGVDILREQADAQVKEPTVVVVYGNREGVDVTAQIKAGSDEVMPLGPTPINATVGDGPILPDDRLVLTLLMPGERIQVLGTNANAAAQELRVVVQLFALSDIARIPALLSNV